MHRWLLLVSLVGCGTSRVPDEARWSVEGSPPGGPSWHDGLAGATRAGAFVGGYDTATTYAADDGRELWTVDLPEIGGRDTVTTTDAVIVERAGVVTHLDPADGHAISTITWACDDTFVLPSASASFVALSGCGDAVEVRGLDSDVPHHTVPFVTGQSPENRFAVGPHGEVVTFDSEKVLRSYDAAGALLATLPTTSWYAELAFADDGDLVVAFAREQRIERLSPSLAQRWSRPIANPTFTIAGNDVVLAEANEVTVLDPTGARRATIALFGFVSALAYAAGTIYAYESQADRLIALEEGAL